MTAKNIFFIGFLLCCAVLQAQQDSIVQLEVVVIADTQLRKFSASQSVTRLNDSVIDSNQPALTSLLNFNTPIYFRENGLGMVASASFRGTTAQQTAVIWNGININSQFNGQTDFNTINAHASDNVSARAGGGSVIYGSSAIGGTVHLENDFSFKPQFTNRVNFQYGSFNTRAANYDIRIANDSWSVDAGIYYNQSDNDFRYPNGRRNKNGQFDNATFKANAAIKINRSNVLKMYNTVFDGSKNFSLLTPTDTETKYTDFNTRSLIEWVNVSKKFTSKIRAAFLSEKYQYYPNISNDAFTGSSAATKIVKYDGLYAFKNVTVNAIVDYTHTAAKGSDISRNNREIISGALLLQHQLAENLQYELGVRNEITSTYKSPLLFSIGVINRFSESYSVKINASRNFRIPSFNDLYWTDGGNPNLLPESAYQVELGNSYRFKNGKIAATGYFNSITDMIQWLPGTTSMWLPQNVTKVETYGGELLTQFEKRFGRTNIEFTGTYAYTVSRNKITGNQLIYTPFHKATAAMALSRGNFTARYQMLFNGAVFILSDNNPDYTVDPYSVSNLIIDHGFGADKKYVVGVKLLNLFDSEYEVIQNRPFPGRNYAIYLTLNF